jgi:hypothetical protein
VGQNYDFLANFLKNYIFVVFDQISQNQNDNDEVPGPREAVEYYLDLRAYGSAKMSKKKGTKRKDGPDGDFLVFSA